MTAPAVLVLEDGRIFHGRSLGVVGRTLGEAVFCTAMTGYQETLTDPSYHRQIVVMTAPHIGNTGINDEDAESCQIWVAGYAVRDPARVASNWRSRGGLAEELLVAGVVGISGLDTRAVTRHLRERGAMRSGIFSGATVSEPDRMLAQVREQPPMAGADIACEVSTRVRYTVPAAGPERYTVAAIDLGVKRASLHRLAAHGATVHVLPADATPHDVYALDPDGVFLSNGPGDPVTAGLDVVRAALTRGTPLLGICLGHEVLGRALGFGTYKLRYGHRGINQPVRDLTTGAIQVTTHNHGFAVDMPATGPADTPFGPAVVTHLCPNDGVVEGLALLDRPAIGVQYHPEAAAGPHDAIELFERFTELMEAKRA